MLRKMVKEFSQCGYKNAQGKKVEKVISWGKNGWQKSNNKVAAYHSVARRMPYSREDFEAKTNHSEIGLIAEVTEQIQIGNPSDKSDQLPSNLRMMYEDSDFLFYGNNVFQAVDPVIQAKDGDWGRDSSMCDSSNAETVTQKALIAIEALHPEVSAEEFNSFLANPWNNAGDLTFFEENEQEAIRRVQEKYSKELENCENDELMQLVISQEMDLAANHHLTTSINSVYCGQGYVAPRTKWSAKDLTGSFGQDAIQASLDREELFYELFSEASTLTSMKDLYGPWNPETRQCEGGFFGKIRDMYRHDVALVKEWNDEAKKEAISKRVYVLEKQGKSPKQIVRIISREFTRKAVNVPAEYDQEGQLIRKSYKLKQSLWDRNKSIAFQELNLTKNQWTSIYSLLNIIKFKLLKNKKADADHIKAASLLMKHFNRISNLDDLKNYQKWAQQRRFIKKDGKRTYAFKPCPLDYVLMNWTSRWHKMVQQRQKELVLDLRKHHNTNRSIVSVKDSGLPEISASCPYPGCGCMVFGSPQIATLEDGSQASVLKCEHNIVPEIKTKVSAATISLKLNNVVKYSQVVEPQHKTSIKCGQTEYGCNKYFLVQ